jgi:hypothetical protein
LNKGDHHGPSSYPLLILDDARIGHGHVIEVARRKLIGVIQKEENYE